MGQKSISGIQKGSQGKHNQEAREGTGAERELDEDADMTEVKPGREPGNRLKDKELE